MVDSLVNVTSSTCTLQVYVAREALSSAALHMTPDDPKSDAAHQPSVEGLSGGAHRAHARSGACSIAMVASHSVDFLHWSLSAHAPSPFYRRHVSSILVLIRSALARVLITYRVCVCVCYVLRSVTSVASRSHILSY